MALFEFAISILLIIAAVFIGLKIIKKTIYVAILAVVLAIILWQLGYLDISTLVPAATTTTTAI